jgi:hypothetical protein
VQGFGNRALATLSETCHAHVGQYTTMNDDNDASGNTGDSSASKDVPSRRVRVIRAGGRPAPPPEPVQPVQPVQPVRASDPRRAPTAYGDPQRQRAGYPGRYPRSTRASTFDARPYIVGGVVTGVITLLLVVVWMLATPNGPFSSRPVIVPAPTISNNGPNPFDVPTEVEPVGTGVPPAIPSGQPTQAAPLPTDTPQPQSLRTDDRRWTMDDRRTTLALS